MNSENFNIPQQPTKSPHAGGEEVPEDIREVPTREFNMPLAQAHAENLIDAIPSTVRLTPEELAMIEARRKKQTQGNAFMNFLKKPVGRASAVLAGLAIAGSATAGIAGSLNANTTPEPGKTVATSPAVPGQTEVSAPPTSQETATPVATQSTEEFVPKSEVLLQTTSLEAMEVMPVEAFARLSPADRFAYYKLHSPNSIIDTPSTDETTSHPNYIMSIWQPMAADALGTKDITVGEKMYLASLYYTTDKSGALSSATQASISDVESINGAGLNENFEFISSGQLQHGVDRNGKVIDFINVTARQTKVVGGAETPNSLQTYQAIREHIKMLNGDEYIMFFQGYTEKGHATPDPKYPY